MAVLLQTKLEPVAAPRFAVDRPRLHSVLDGAWHRRLTVVVAPAGYGKSTLIGQWGAEQAQDSVAWLSLDSRDVDPVRFGGHLISALRAVCPMAGERSTDAIGPVSDALGDEVVDILIDELLTVERDIVLVLEDLEHLEGSRIMADLERLVQEAPPRLHVLVTSRVDPSLGLHRLRTADGLAELRIDDLRFTADEAAEVVHRLSGRRLADDEAAYLSEVSEGWPVAVQLATISLRDTNTGGSIFDFGGADRNLVDYLSAELLRHEPERVRSFLLDVSVLETANGALCDAVMGRHDSAELLAELHHRALFIAQVPGAPGWYRLHRLVRAFLLNDLRTALPERPAELGRRAASWYLQHYDDPGQAASYLVGARAWDELVQLIDTHGRTMWQRGHGAALLHLIDAVPASVRRRSAHVQLTDAAIRLIAGRPEGALAVLADIERSQELRKGEATLVDVLRCALVSGLNPARADVVRADEACAALSALPKEAVPVILGSTAPADAAVLLHCSSAQARLLMGDGRAIEHASHVLDASPSTQVIFRIQGHGVLALAEALQWRVTTATAQAAHALDVADQRLGRHHPATILASAAHAVVARSRNDVQAGIAHASAALVLAERWNHRPMASLLLGERALLALAQGDLDAAMDWVRRARQLPMASLAPLVEGRLRSVELRVRLARGAGRDLWRGVDPASLSTSWELAAAATTAAVEVEDVGRARKILDLWPPGCAPFGEIERELATTLVEHAEGDTNAARVRLTAVLAHTAPEGVTRPYLDAGRLVIALLHDQQPDRPHQHVDAILRAAPRSADPTELVDPLSGRELEVLEHLPTRRSNAQIAEELFVSTNTVKTHIKHIYQKLGATDRDDAVRRARQLGLL